MDVQSAAAVRTKDMSYLTVVFRTDASLDIGTGHVMRCLTLADALREHGANCRFVCRAQPGDLIDLIRQRGYDVYVLPFIEELATSDSARDESPPAHASWLGTDWITDAKLTLSALSGTRIDWLIVDHYALDARWEQTLRSACCHLMVIDDLADRPHECELLLDQNLGRTSANYADLVSIGCTILAGPKYALLRPEFAALRQESLGRRATPQLKHLLITMGGVDRGNATGQVLDALKDCPLPVDCRITVVMGPHAPWLTQVREQAAQLPWSIKVLVNVSDMAKLMTDSDLAIGAAGSTSWERCCLGLPSILVVLAENQLPIAKALDAAGATRTTSVLTLATDINSFLCQDAITSSLTQTSSLAANVTSGEGAAIVSQILFAKESS